MTLESLSEQVEKIMAAIDVLDKRISALEDGFILDIMEGGDIQMGSTGSDRTEDE